MEYIVPEIIKVVEKIEENGGSVRFQWIPGHITESKAAEYAHAFSAEDGGMNNDLVKQYKLGNNASDALAGSTTRLSNFKKFGAPKVTSITALKEDAMDNYQDRSKNNEPIC